MDEAAVRKALGNNIQYLRARRSLNQQPFADQLSISVRRLSQWENGETTPTLDQLMNLAKHLQVDLERLLRGTRLLANDESTLFQIETAARSLRLQREFLQLLSHTPRSPKDFYEDGLHWVNYSIARDYLYWETPDALGVLPDQFVAVFDFHLNLSRNRHRLIVVQNDFSGKHLYVAITKIGSELLKTEIPTNTDERLNNIQSRVEAALQGASQTEVAFVLEQLEKRFL